MAKVPVLNVPEQLPNVTGEVAGILKTVQDREDATVVLDAEAKLKEITAKRQIGYQQLRGINASGLTNQAEKDWNDTYKTFYNAFETPRQKELFRQRSLGTRAAHIE